MINIGFPIFSYLEDDNNEILTKIEVNHFNIVRILSNEPECEEFVSQLNNVILKKKENFDLIEKVLKHCAFSIAIDTFRKSDILIRACEKENENEPVLRWLLTMEIDTCVQDNKGMTALMHAARKPNLLFVVQYLIYNCNACINLTDHDGNTALFHAIRNIEAFKALLNANTNVNHINKQKDTVLLHCCKSDIVEPVKHISFNSNVDVNITDKEGRNAAMYLVENGRYHEFQLLTGTNIDLDYRNEKDETLLSILIRSIYRPEVKEENSDYIIPCIKILMILIQMDCNFNISIDKEGNTPLMFFIMIEDVYTVHYMLTFCRTLNVSTKNKNGESAFSLSLKLGNKNLIELLMNHPTFDFSDVDQNGNNLLMLYSLLNNTNIIRKVLDRNPTLLNQTNVKGEHALIIATKLQSLEVVKIFLENNVYIDQQDNFGNTALHYAVQMNLPEIINALAYSHADINIKNSKDQSPYDLAKASSDPKILDYLEHPTPIKFSKPQKKGKLFSIKKITKRSSSRKRSYNERSNEYLNVKNYNDVIAFSINDHENPYQPLKNANSHLEMETYGYKDAIQPETGVSKNMLRKAMALETLTAILELTEKFI